MLSRLDIPLENANGTKTSRIIKMNYRTQESRFTPAVRRSILQRDGNRCQMPGCRSKADSTLEVHHIVSVRNSGATKKENVITLCHSCHDAIKGIEEEYIQLFQEIVKHNS